MKKVILVMLLWSSVAIVFGTMGLSQNANAQSVSLEQFNDGPLIQGYGMHAAVINNDFKLDTKFKVAFDVAKQAEEGEINRKFDSLARFLNMHVAAGVSPENIELALVVHGKASMDLLKGNANKELLNLLMKNNVRVTLCGQSAAAYKIDHSQLTEGVNVTLSAMTAHAQLQQLGYTVNPF